MVDNVEVDLYCLLVSCFLQIEFNYSNNLLVGDKSFYLLPVPYISIHLGRDRSMAEAAILFSLASKILIKVASPAFKKAYERTKSIRGARKELEELRQTIGSIQTVLVDAENRKEGSDLVKKWMERVRDVLYDADDLFDEVTTVDLLKQQNKGNEFSIKVQIFSSKLTSMVYNDSIAKKVKAIRKALHRISVDMNSLDFLKCQIDEKPTSTRKEVMGTFVDPNRVIGREVEKEAVLKFLLDESKAKESISVFAVVGIGGMGKTTVAQLIYNDNEVEKCFNCKWWASISDIVDEKEVLEKIAQSMGFGNPTSCDVSMLQSKISGIVRSAGKYLLVLDDVWDIAASSPTLWLNIMSLLEYGAQGSKVIVTTRSLSVPRLMLKDKSEVLELEGLSDVKSWELFKAIAFTSEQENDQEWTSLGRAILSKCANVPLTIRSIAAILRRKTTKIEWESIKNEKLLSDGTTISALKLSYHHLPSYLKLCFAYCSLIPKGDSFVKDHLVNLWIAQGYVTPKDGETFEAAGHCYFMDLLNWSFFQIATKRSYVDPMYYKMHDLVHELADCVVGEESGIIVQGSNHSHLQDRIRHLKIIYINRYALNISSLLTANRLRSFLFLGGGVAVSPSFIDQVLTNFKLLRALSLRCMNIKNVPDSIGELLHLRYLDLSKNQFTILPNSITNLVNLIILNLWFCCHLQMLPNDFHKLVNLRQLNTGYCDGLSHMPPDLGELSQLQSLSYFKVGRAVSGGKSSRLPELARLNISGALCIDFSHGEDVEECWQVPAAITDLGIENHQGIRIPQWGVGEPHKTPCLPTNLVRLRLEYCPTIKHLPPLRCLPCLEALTLSGLGELEYIEEDEAAVTASSTMSIYFPCLKYLKVSSLPKFRRWSAACQEMITESDPPPYLQMTVSFPLLEVLKIYECPKLVHMPLSQQLKTLEFASVTEELMQQLLSATPSSLSCMDTLSIRRCDWLRMFSSEALTSLRCLKFAGCRELQKLHKSTLLQLSNLEELGFFDCPKLELWEEDDTGVDWDSLPSLHKLNLATIPHPDSLPECLQQRQTLGKLQIRKSSFSDSFRHSYVPARTAFG